jgi:hypothetical protein
MTNEDTPEAQNRINAEEESSNNSSQEAASVDNDGQQYGPEALEAVRSQSQRLMEGTLYSIVDNLFGETREFLRVHRMKTY